MKLSIRAQIRLLVTVLAVGFGLCVLTTFRVLANRQADQAIRADGEAVQSALRMFVKGRGGLQKKLTNFLATTPRVRMLTEADDKTAIDAIEGLRDTAGVDGMLLLGGDGKLMASTGLKDVKGTQSAIKALSGKALEGKAGQAIVEADGDPMLATAEPLEIGGYVKGGVVTFLRMDSAMAKTIGNNVRGNIAFYHEGRI
ncbi:hypothetical protein EON82_03845, partial [bacterium]